MANMKSVLGILTLCVLAQHITDASPQDWPSYGNDAGGSRYSALADIKQDNVAGLSLAWSYRTGDLNLSELFNAKAAP